MEKLFAAVFMGVILSFTLFGIYTAIVQTAC